MYEELDPVILLISQWQ